MDGSVIDRDRQISETLINEFKRSAPLHYARLNVHVQEGVVTIAGRVTVEAERRAVEGTARKIVGIDNLILEIAVATTPVYVHTS